MSGGFLASTDVTVDRAARAMLAGEFQIAEATLRTILAQEPDNVVALRMLGEVAATFGAYRDAERLHRRALELSPQFAYARLHLAITLHDQQRNGEALAEVEQLTGDFGAAPETLELKGSLLWRTGDYDRAADLFSQVIALDPQNVAVRLRLANVLRTLGRTTEAIAVCRAALEISPGEGAIWWALADIKTMSFSDADVDRMKGALSSANEPNSRAALHFALGKALGDKRETELSWAHYTAGNDIKAQLVPYHPADLEQFAERSERLFTRKFLLAHAETGDPSTDPIFIVGLPRSGSTLVEQILASHSQIEGTAELPDIDILARTFERDPLWASNWKDYPCSLGALSPDQLRQLGETYLERTRIQRKSARPYFIDKLPRNWMHIGFIKLILPNAKIIDARRHPLACGYSNYRQLYAREHAYSYDLRRFAQHYRLYLRMMDHFESVSPGMVHRVIHERLVASPEQEIPRLLAFLGLPFEPACLAPHETVRAVRTASAEQVRQPIGASAHEDWRTYEQHLGPLKAQLESALYDWDAR